MHRLLVSMLAGVLALATLADVVSGRPDSPQARVKGTLLQRGYDSAKVSCERPPLPVGCETRGVYRNGNGALERCTREASVSESADLICR